MYRRSPPPPCRSALQPPDIQSSSSVVRAPPYRTARHAPNSIATRTLYRYATTTAAWRLGTGAWTWRGIFLAPPWQGRRRARRTFELQRRCVHLHRWLYRRRSPAHQACSTQQTRVIPTSSSAAALTRRRRNRAASVGFEHATSFATTTTVGCRSFVPRRRCSGVDDGGGGEGVRARSGPTRARLCGWTAHGVSAARRTVACVEPSRRGTGLAASISWCEQALLE